MLNAWFDRTRPMLPGTDVGLALGVVSLLAVLVLPLPTVLLDLGLAVSITASVLVLMVAMFLVRPLDFTSFPTLLLLTTLLRLSLNVATTRLILSHGHEGPLAAGHVVQAFGGFLMGGDVVIGVILFTVLLVVNFMVITKGSGRIAEVAARFSLDAMPGKQMAIDADLSAGLIDEKTARVRRRELEEESGFFGAMDGAAKFVRGDAIAGLLITVINIFGGLAIGLLRHGMPFADAAATFTTLTVGDGLVSQIPALLVSTAAGIVVTKGGMEGTADAALMRQLGGSPKPLAMASGAAVVLAIMPGLPTLPFLFVGALFGAGAWLRMKNPAVAPDADAPVVAAVGEARAKSRQQVAEDMRDLVDRFADHAGLNARPSYQALVTVFGQQCEIVEDRIVVKAKTGGRCVQNPSDLGATFDGHKGQGHKVQLVETCSDANDVQLILTALPQTAVDHDTAALAPVLADLKEKDLLPEQMLADTPYGSDENVQHAATLGVELVTPTPGNEPVNASSDETEAASTPPETDSPSSDMPLSPPLEKLTIDDFAMDERTGKVTACPSGRIPLQVLYEQGPRKDKTTIEMRPEDCGSCPYREACPTRKTKKGKYVLDYTSQQRRQQERRREEDTDAFRERYGKRAGLESTNSGLKRKFGLGALRVRGSPGVHHAIYLKVAGWNVSRAAASGKLASRAAEILRKLGFGGIWAACRPANRLINRVYGPWRPVLTANAA